MIDFPSKEDFAAAVQSYLDDGRSPRAMAEEFEVAPSTVGRWAKGTANPHKRLRRQIVEWIRAT